MHISIIYHFNPLSLTSFVCLLYIILMPTYYIICHGSIIFYFNISVIHPLLYQQNEGIKQCLVYTA